MKNFIGVLCFVLTLFSTFSKGAWAKDLVIMHISDTHEIYQGDSESVHLARAATLLNKIRNENADADVLLVHSGDFLSPSISVATSVFRGQDVVEALNALKIDVATLGNHEFDFGYDNLAARLKEVKFPIVNSNIVHKDSGERIERVRNHWIVEKSGLRIAFVGAVVREQTQPSLNKFDDAILVLDPIETLKKEIQEIRDQKLADMVIVLSHQEIEEEQRMAKEVPGIDLILGGHTHTNVFEIIQSAAPVAEGASPKMVPLSKVENDFRGVGVVRVKHAKGNFEFDRTYLPVPKNIARDPQLSAVMDRYMKKMEHELAMVVGELPESLDGTHETIEAEVSKLGRSPVIGTFLTGIYQRWFGADAAVLNSGSVARANRVFEAGKMTLKDTNQLLPYEDPVLVIQTTPALFKGLLEGMIHGAIIKNRPTVFPSLGGVDVAWDLTKPQGERVTKFVRSDGTDILAAPTIKVAINKYLFESAQSKELRAGSTVIANAKGLPSTLDLFAHGVAFDFSAIDAAVRSGATSFSNALNDFENGVYYTVPKMLLDTRLKAGEKFKLITENPNKVHEFFRFMGNLLQGSSLPEGTEFEGSPEEIVKQMAFQNTPLADGTLRVFEDTSLEVNGVGNRISVATYKKNGKMCEILGKKARWVSRLAYQDMQGHVHLYVGSVPGLIVEPSVMGGFGFDPYFVPDGAESGKSLAESKPPRFNARWKAVMNFLVDVGTVFPAAQKAEPCKVALVEATSAADASKLPQK